MSKHKQLSCIKFDSRSGSEKPTLKSSKKLSFAKTPVTPAHMKEITELIVNNIVGRSETNQHI